MENEDENENALTIPGNEVDDPIWPILIGRTVFRRFRRRRCRRGAIYQERIKELRELIPHIGSVHIVIPLKIFLDLL